VVAPSKAAQFPKWPLPGRCFFRVSSEAAKENLSATPPQRKLTSNQDFATRKQISRTSTKHRVPGTRYQVLGTRY
jgi:hypothetical protein